ncbi:MAG: hypothetical protein F9K43_16970 [Bauldia sp.]|nr:MAG: hypothetical protein F9K43_16970 [Bauldia sp.]
MFQESCAGPPTRRLRQAPFKVVDKNKGAEMPLIRISHAARYDQPAKDRILADVTAAYAAAAGCDPAKVWVILEEIERTDWSTGGIALAARAASAG